MRAEALGPDVGLAVDGRDDVRPGHAGRRTRSARSARSRASRRPSRRRRPPLCPRRPRREASRPSARRGRAGGPPGRRPRSGRAPPASRGRRFAALPRRGRSGATPRLPRARAGERRVRVPEDDDRVGALRGDHLADARRAACPLRGAEVEPVCRLRQPELLEEDRGELVVPVLPRVDDDLVDPASRGAPRERRRLDELRPVADDGEHLHRADPSQPLGPLAQLVEQRSVAGLRWWPS